MRSGDLDSAIPTGKVFFPVGMREINDEGSIAPSLDFTGRGGLVLIGLGRSGEDTLQKFFERLGQYPGASLPVVRALSIIADNEQISDDYNDNIEHFFIDAGNGTETIEAATDQQQTMLGNIRKYLEDQFFEFQRKSRTGSDIRCFLIASSSEGEIGLLHPLLGILAGNRASFSDRALFLLFDSPNAPALEKQLQYSIMRELSHYLQTGVHDTNSHVSDKLLERIYFFEGSKRSDDHQGFVLAVAETLLTFVNGGANLRRFEAVTQTLDGNHRIRTVGIRSLAVPLLELKGYFASRLIMEMWAQTKTLLPSNVPSDDDINAKFQAFHNDRSYSIYLEEWLGVEFARWLLNQGSPLPRIEEMELSLQFIQRMLNFLSDIQRPERYAIAWSGLWFVEGRVAGFPILKDACQKFRSGLEKFFDEIPSYREFLETLIKNKRDVLYGTTSSSISRWNVRNLDERSEQMFERIFGEGQKERVFSQIRRHSGLSAKYAGTFQFSPVLLPPIARKAIVISDYIWGDFRDYFGALAQILGGLILSRLIESAERIQELDNTSLAYLSEIDQPLANMESLLPSENKQGFLIASNDQDVDLIKRRIFKFTASGIHILREDNKSLTALTIFTGLRMDGFRYIRQCAAVYTPDEKTHIDEHLQNAAYFEKQLRKLPNKHARVPFNEQLIMTLSDRNVPIAFINAYMAGRLKWQSTKMSWRIEPIMAKKYEFPELDFSCNQAGNLTQPMRKESIKSLWAAYCRFSLEMPFQEVRDGDFQHPLHVKNRSRYLETLVSLSRLDGSAAQTNRRKWLEKQAEERRDQVELYDFYRLFQAVMKCQ